MVGDDAISSAIKEPILCPTIENLLMEILSKSSKSLFEKPEMVFMVLPKLFPCPGRSTAKTSLFFL